MKSLRLLLVLAALPSCSLLYDGSAYRGGDAEDAAVTDVGASDTPLPDGSMPGMCTSARITECMTSSQFCDPATGSCVASCTNAICAALDPGRPICSGSACVACGDDMDCGINGVCESAACVDCDGDDDGFPRGGPGCARARPLLPRDCDDTDDAIYPGALPICDDGIDQSCSGGDVAGGLATEFGRYPPLEIPVPPGTDRPGRLRVFMTGPSRALVFLTAGDVNRTAIVADVDLAAGTVLSSGPLLDIVGVSLDTLAQSDAIRIGSGNVVVSMLSTQSGGAGAFSATVNRLEYDVPGRTWSADEVTTDLSGADTQGFMQFGDAALVHRSDDVEYVVTAARVNGLTDPRLFAIGVATPGVVEIAPASAVAGATRPWIESAGNAAVFASPSGEVRFWNGNFVAGDRSFVAGSVTGVASTAATLWVRGAGDDNRIAVLVPGPTTLSAFTPSCGGTDPLHECGSFVPGPESPATYPLMNITEPAIAATRVSSTALIVATTRMAAGGPEIAFMVLETGPLSGSLLELPVSIVTDGTPRDVAVDALLTPDGGDMTGEMTLAGLYLEEQGPRRSVFLVGARGCIGYDEP